MVRNNKVKSAVIGRVWKRGLFRSSSCKISLKFWFRVTTLNVVILIGIFLEVAERIPRSIYLCCSYTGEVNLPYLLQENKLFFFWVGNHVGRDGIGKHPAEKWVEKVSDVNHVSGCIVLLILLVEETIITVFPVCICSMVMTWQCSTVGTFLCPVETEMVVLVKVRIGFWSCP